MLIPMYFLIGIWGGPNRVYAAIKFFLYTLIGSVLMLIAILMLYFNSDLTKLTPDQLVDARVITVVEGSDAAAAQSRLDELNASIPTSDEEFAAKDRDLTRTRQMIAVGRRF